MAHKYNHKVGDKVFAKYLGKEGVVTYVYGSISPNSEPGDFVRVRVEGDSSAKPWDLASWDADCFDRADSWKPIG